MKRIIKLGDEAKDVITGYRGIITAKIEYLTGQIDYKIQKQSSDSDKYAGSEWINENYLLYVSDGVHIEPAKREAGFTTK